MTKMIATWRMSHESFLNLKDNQQNKTAKELIIESISFIEDEPCYQSVGFGGLPNQDGIVEQDAAFMDGKTFAIGALMGVKNIKNPIKVAQKLSLEKYNNFLVGLGAEKYATIHGFEFKNMLLTQAKMKYETKKTQIDQGKMQPYDGHDTVGVIALDNNQQMAVGTSTSGLFFKKEGRVGDSALPGSGFYCDQKVGGCVATGLGEDIAKGVLSFAIVQKIKDGVNVQKACDQVLWDFVEQLKTRNGRVGEMSVVALDQQGNFGISTNVEFTFCVMENERVKVYKALPDETKKVSEYLEMSETEIDDYLIKRGHYSTAK